MVPSTKPRVLHQTLTPNTFRSGSGPRKKVSTSTRCPRTCPLSRRIRTPSRLLTLFAPNRVPSLESKLFGLLLRTSISHHTHTRATPSPSPRVLKTEKKNEVLVKGSGGRPDWVGSTKDPRLYRHLNTLPKKT